MTGVLHSVWQENELRSVHEPETLPFVDRGRRIPLDEHEELYREHDEHCHEQAQRDEIAERWAGEYLCGDYGPWDDAAFAPIPLPTPELMEVR